MRRYIRDPRLREFAAKVSAEIMRAGKLGEGGGYVTYAIRDPSLADRRGHPDGPCIYVGQTKNLRTRAKDHMEDGGRETRGGRCRNGRIYQVMAKGRVPKFEVLERVPTHLASLASETLWARRFTWLGYTLANGWPEHLIPEKPAGREGVPLKRLWRFSIEEAIADNLRASLDCRKCDISHLLELEALRAYPDPPKTLTDVRKATPRCPGCGGYFLKLEIAPPQT